MKARKQWGQTPWAILRESPSHRQYPGEWERWRDRGAQYEPGEPSRTYTGIVGVFRHDGVYPHLTDLTEYEPYTPKAPANAVN